MEPETDSSGRPKVIVFKELLTQENKKLLDAAKKVLSTKVKFIWCSKGRIYVRKAETDKEVIWIKSSTDIQRIVDTLIAQPGLSNAPVQNN